MSNMTMDFNPPTPPKPVQVFTIIRLTNHAPVRVLLDEWKALAEGRWNNGDPESPYYQEIGIRALYLREPWKIPVRTVGDGETIVHAWACLDDGEYDRRTERVHADRLLTAMETADRGSCDRHILAVADELRERIKDEGLRRSVTEAVDLSRRARDGATVQSERRSIPAIVRRLFSRASRYAVEETNCLICEAPAPIQGRALIAVETDGKQDIGCVCGGCVGLSAPIARAA